MNTFQNGKFNISGESVVENLELLTVELDASISGIIITDSLIQTTEPDLIILDLWIPVLSGDQILKMIRSTPKTKDFQL